MKYFDAAVALLWFCRRYASISTYLLTYLLIYLVSVCQCVETYRWRRVVCESLALMREASVWRGRRPSRTVDRRSLATSSRSVAAAALPAGRPPPESTAAVWQPSWPACRRTTCTSSGSSPRTRPASARSRANSANRYQPRNHFVSFSQSFACSSSRVLRGFLTSVSVCVCLFFHTTSRKNDDHQIWRRDVPRWVLETHLFWGQEVKGQGH